MTLPSTAIAGGNLTWIDGVTVSSNFDYSTDQISTSISSYLTTGGSFGVADFTNAFVPGGTQYFSIIDSQGTSGAITVDVTYASWNFDAANGGGSVPLYVYSYPSSPDPPAIDSVPTGPFLDEVDIPVGDYTSSPYALTLYGNNINGGTALLLETLSSTTLGSPSISFDDPSDGGSSGVDPAGSVPEPSSWVMLGTALSAMIVLARRNRDS